jgi:hypothetical protein
MKYNIKRRTLIYTAASEAELPFADATTCGFFHCVKYRGGRGRDGLARRMTSAYDDDRAVCMYFLKVSTSCN